MVFLFLFCLLLVVSQGTTINGHVFQLENNAIHASVPNANATSAWSCFEVTGVTTLDYLSVSIEVMGQNRCLGLNPYQSKNFQPISSFVSSSGCTMAAYQASSSGLLHSSYLNFIQSVGNFKVCSPSYQVGSLYSITVDVVPVPITN
jgi:hypothetical protein